MKKNIDKEQQKKLQELIDSLLRLMLLYYQSVLLLPDVKKSIANDSTFWFAQHLTANKQVEKYLKNLNADIIAEVLNGIDKAYSLGSKNFEEKVGAQIAKIATDSHRQQAALSKAEQLKLSERVWNCTTGSKKEIETVIQNGIKEGLSADQISGKLSSYLKNPNLVFRKVRNKETGELEWSEAAKKYHPGQGVYRSSYKNLMRLVRTEVNAAYRGAEWLRYQQNPMIVGYEIRLSNNHTTLINGIPTPFHDICDELAGIYPKTFRWLGWHPQCRCAMIPILASDEEYRKMVQAENKGEEYLPKQITKMPDNFKKWMEDNNSRISIANNRGTLPNFIKNNVKITGITVNPINTKVGQAIIQESFKKYNSYGDEWEKVYFDKFSGGYNVVHKQHNFAKTGGGGDAEKTVGKMLAKYNGKQVEFLQEGEKKSLDVRFDGQEWDIKYIDNANEKTIRGYIEDVKKADNAIFYFTKEEQYLVLNNAVEREKGKFLKGQMSKMPDIYFIDKDKILKLLYGK